MYGNEQAQYTMYRAAYGDNAANMMMGANTIYGGAYTGINNMLSDIGGMVMPVGYMPPARVNVGFYGQYAQRTGFFSSAAGAMGLSGPGRSQMAADYMNNVGSDFGERIGGGAVGLAGSLAGMGMGSAIGRVLGGGIIGGLAGTFAGAAIAGAVTDAVGQRREINNFLEQSSFRYVSAGSPMADARRGGMSSSARLATTDMIRQMDIKDPFMSTEDLTTILQQGTQKGLFAGTQNMDDFKKKFTELTDTVKMVTRTLGQSLEQAMSTIKELKSIGIDPAQARQVVGSADTLGRMAGRTGAEMLNIGLQGAEMFRGTGVTMGIGAQASMMNLASVRASRDAGLLSNEAIAQAGGEEALALRMNASGLAFGQSGLGRGFGAAFFNNGMGGAGFNQQGFMQQMLTGGKGIIGLAQQATGNMASLPAMIAYQANQEKFMSEVGTQFGGRGLQMMQTNLGMQQAEYLSKMTGAKFEDSYRLSLKQMGLSQSEIDTNIAEARGAVQINKKANAAAQMVYERSMMEEGYRQNSLVEMGNKIRDFGKSVVDTVARPLDRIVETTKVSVRDFVEEQVYGVQRADVSDINLGRTIAGAKKTSKGIANLDVGGHLFGTTAGEAIAKALDPETARALGINVRSGSSTMQTYQGEAIIESGLLGGKTVINVDKAIKAAEKYNFTSEDAKKAQADGVFKTVKGGTLLDIIASGNTATDMNSLAKAAYGKNASDLTKEELMKLSVEVKGTVYETSFNKTQQAGKTVLTARDAIESASVIKATKDYRDASDDIRTKMTISTPGLREKISDDAIQAIADAAGETDPEKKKAKMAEAEAALLHSGMGTSDSKMLLAKGVKLTAEGSKLATAHETIKAAQLQRGSTALTKQLEYSVLTGKMTKDETAKALGAVTDLAKADTPEKFVAAVDKSEDLVKEMGATGVQVVKARDILKKIDGKMTGKDLKEQLSGIGLEPDSQMLNALQNSDFTGLKSKIVEAIKAQKASTSVVSGASGVSPEGGTSAAQTLSQQVNINNQILVAMTNLADRLSKK